MRSASRRNLARRVIAKPRTRTVPKETRHKHLPEEKRLCVPALDAPLGTYAIDQVVEEFRVSGIFRSEPGNIEDARKSVYIAGEMAICNAKGVLERTPNYQHHTHRFLKRSRTDRSSDPAEPTARSILDTHVDVSVFGSNRANTTKS
jgi:hypothetical protein